MADFGKQEAHGVLRDRLFDTWSKADRADGELTADGKKTLLSALQTEADRLRAAAGQSNATILIGIDQSEEIARADAKRQRMPRRLSSCRAPYIGVAFGIHYQN